MYKEIFSEQVDEPYLRYQVVLCSKYVPLQYSLVVTTAKVNVTYSDVRIMLSREILSTIKAGENSEEKTCFGT